VDDSTLHDDFSGVARQVRELAHHVDGAQDHRARLRNELLSRHAALYGPERRRASRGVRFPTLRRLGLLAAPALAGAVALSAVFWGLQVSGHQNTQSAEAARITQALTQTIPTVTAWHWTVHETVGHRQYVILYSSALTSNQRIYVRYNRVYLYSNGSWALAPADQWAESGSTADPTMGARDWQWAFAALPEMLQRGDVRFLATRSLAGHATVGIRYSRLGAGGVRVMATAWVDERTGLLVRMQQMVTRAGKALGSDWVDFQFRVSA